MSADEALKNITIIVIVLFILVLIQWGCNYYISNYKESRKEATELLEKQINSETIKNIIEY